MWRVARDSGSLDLNSPYSYLLWCRDFASTSVAARTRGDTLAGFVTGYVRPDAPDTVVVWQIAVDGTARGRGLASAMLHHLVHRLEPAGISFLEATLTPGNEASGRLFAGFARDTEAAVERRVLFGAELFPQSHEPEVLLRIGPVRHRPGGGMRSPGHP